jgi:serralysin
MQSLSSCQLRLIVSLLLAIVAQHWSPPSARAFILAPNTRWTSTASNASTGTYGNPITLTWSLVPDGTGVSNSYAPTNGTTSSLISTFDASFGAGPGGSDLTQRPWFHLFSDSFNGWNQLGGINFIYESHDTTLTLGSSTGGTLGVRGDIRIGAASIDGTNGTLAETLLPQVGDILIDTADMSFFSDATSNHLAFRNTLMHEVGHAFGLEHVISDTNDFLMEPVINLNFDGPQLDEVRAIQYFYGDPNEKSHNMRGNNTAALATTLGSLGVGSSIDVGSSAVGKDSGANLVVSPNESDFVSIFGNTDADYYSFNVSSPMKLSAVLTPRGGIFNQGQQGGSAPTQTDATSKNDLSLALFGSDGATQLALINNAVAGSAETLSNFTLSSAGEYYLRVSGATADTVQLYDLVLSAINILIGDYNHDGIVDAADFVLWRKGLGKAFTQDDYNLWRTNFGHTAPGAGSGSSAIANAAVPEPTTMTLFILAATGLCLRRQGSGSRVSKLINA